MDIAIKRITEAIEQQYPGCDLDVSNLVYLVKYPIRHNGTTKRFAVTEIRATELEKSGILNMHDIMAERRIFEELDKGTPNEWLVWKGGDILERMPAD